MRNYSAQFDYSLLSQCNYCCIYYIAPYLPYFQLTVLPTLFSGLFTSFFSYLFDNSVTFFFPRIQTTSIFMHYFIYLVIPFCINLKFSLVLIISLISCEKEYCDSISGVRTCHWHNICGKQTTNQFQGELQINPTVVLDGTCKGVLFINHVRIKYYYFTIPIKNVKVIVSVFVLVQIQNQ